MNVKDWKKFLIPPLALYAVIFLFISALIGAKIDAEAIWVWIVNLGISIVGLYIATNYAKPENWRQGLKFGLVWLVIFFVLDLVLTVPFAGKDYFSDWKSYIPYVLTVAIPTFLASQQKPQQS
ncbi:MAG TPA: hypothetical protein VIH52_03885 [Candidatus Nanoarchaeia archaeon]|nr:hypothetical protein [uncultured archaeon]